MRRGAMRIPRARGVGGALLALLAWGSVGCGGASKANGNAATETVQDEAAEDAIAVEVGPVRRGSLSSVYSTSATLRADKRATVTARTRGVVREILVEEGDAVEQGQPLAILEDDEQRIAFAQARATADNRERELERAEALHGQGLMSDEAYETTRRQAVEAGHTAELAELELGRTVIRATFPGRVLRRHLDPGAIVDDGTPVFDVADLDPLYADVQVPERQVSRLTPGQQVRVLADEDTRAGAAAIERIAPAVDPQTGTVKVTVAVRGGRGLRPGGFVRVGIVTDTHDGALVVPRSALVAEGRRWHLFRLKDGEPDRVEQLEVTRGFEEGNRVEIVGTAGAGRPLDEGDRVVVTGASSLSEGALVQVLGGDGNEGGEGDRGDEEGQSEESGVAA